MLIEFEGTVATFKSKNVRNDSAKIKKTTLIATMLILSNLKAPSNPKM